MLRIEVEGRPAPQGSKHRGAHGQMREASPYLPAWRAAVRNTAHRTLNALGVPAEVRPHFRGAVVVRHLEFIMHPGQRVDSPPDLDKLLRAVLDALKYAGVFEDDGRVVRIEHASKRHPHPGEPLGCVIELDSFQETETPEMTKLYRLVLEEVEINGNAPVVVGQVVGDAAMVESVLPALARRLVPNEAAATGTGTAYVHIDPASPAEPAAMPATEAPAEPVKRGRGRPRKVQPPAAPITPPAAPGGAEPAGAAYDPFKQVAGTPQ